MAPPSYAESQSEQITLLRSELGALASDFSLLSQSVEEQRRDTRAILSLLQEMTHRSTDGSGSEDVPDIYTHQHSDMDAVGSVSHA